MPESPVSAAPFFFSVLYFDRSSIFCITLLNCVTNDLMPLTVVAVSCPMVTVTGCDADRLQSPASRPAVPGDVVG